MVLNAGNALLEGFDGSDIMNKEDVSKACEVGGLNMKVIAVHIDALNHCVLSRQELRQHIAVDPSESMLKVCRDRLQGLRLADRCQFVKGVVHDVPEIENFDAALCLLVLHHTSQDERLGIVTGVAKRLKTNGYFISSELSADLSVKTADNIMENWKSLSRIFTCIGGKAVTQIILHHASMHPSRWILSSKQLDDLRLAINDDTTP